MARAASAPVVSFIPALPCHGHVTDAGRSYFFTVTPGEGVTLRLPAPAGEIGSRVPQVHKTSLRSAVLSAYRAARAASAVTL